MQWILLCVPFLLIFFSTWRVSLCATFMHTSFYSTSTQLTRVLFTIYRQRQTSTTATPFALAQKHLPRELLQELRMPVPAPLKKRRRRSGPTGDADEG